MLFSTTACPRCGKKIDKSDIILVETKIKTVVKCCPSCIKYIDVKRRINPKNIPIGKKETGITKPQTPRYSTETQEQNVKPESETQNNESDFDEDDPLGLLKEIKGAKQEEENTFLKKAPKIGEELNKELEKPDEKPKKITSVNDLFKKSDEETPPPKHDPIEDDFNKSNKEDFKSFSDDFTEEKEIETIEEEPPVTPVKEPEEKIEPEPEIIKEEPKIIEEEPDPILDEPEPEIEKSEPEEIEPETIEEPEPPKQETKPEPEPEKEETTKETETKTEKTKEEEKEKIDENMQLNTLDLKILKKLKETGSLDIESLSEELKVEPNEIFQSLMKLKEYGICKEKDEKTEGKPETIKEVEKEIDTKIEPEPEKIEPETIEQPEPPKQETKPEPEPEKEETTKEIIKEEPQPPAKKEEKIQDIHKEIDESPFKQKNNQTAFDRERSEKIKKDWRSEWIVTSKEAENIISSTVEKKEKNRKKKFQPLKKFIKK